MAKKREPFKNLKGWFISGREFLWRYWVAIALAIVLSYVGGRLLDAQAWSGFHGNKYGDAKTLWDWLDLLIVPIVLAIGAYIFNRRAAIRDKEREEAAKEREIQREEANRERDRQMAEAAKERDREWEAATRHEEILQEYLDDMSQLLMDRKLKEALKKRNSAAKAKADASKTESGTDNELPVVDVARARTVSTLRRLNTPERRKELLDFLRDAGLYNGETALLRNAKMDGIDLKGTNLYQIDLSGASLIKADLEGAELEGAILAQANLVEAELRRAYLFGTNLEGAELVEANLARVSLIGANLAGAILMEADLEGADLVEANLARVNLIGANLAGAVLMEADLEGAYLVVSALRLKSPEIAT